MAASNDGSATDNDRSADSDRASRVIPIVLLVALALGVPCLVFLWGTVPIYLWAAVLWGLALYVTGVLVGFIFGIPRVVDRDGNALAAKESGGKGDGGTSEEPVSAASKTRVRSTTNSNLVEVSDWLTKIIVGVGLVELKRLPGHGESLAAFIAQGVMPDNKDARGRHLHRRRAGTVLRRAGLRHRLSAHPRLSGSGHESC